MKLIVIFLMTLASSIHGVGQLVHFSPAKVSIGDSLTISYNRLDSLAELKNEQEVYARIITYKKNGAIDNSHLRLKPSPEEFISKLFISPGTVSIKVQFYCLNRDDMKCETDIIIYDKESGKPVPGAYMNNFSGKASRQAFEAEVLNTAVNYLVYARYFNALSHQDPDGCKPEINAHLAVLQKQLVDRKPASAGLKAALCTGYAKVDNIPEARKLLLDLIDNYEGVAEVNLAVYVNLLDCFTVSELHAGSELFDKLRTMFLKFPSSALASNSSVIAILKSDSTIPVSCFEKALLPAVTTGKTEYSDLGKLSEIYISRKIKLKDAEQMLLDGIHQFETGTINHQYRLAPYHYQRYVSFMLLQLANISWLTGNYSQSIARCSAALNIISENSAGAYIIPGLLETRAASFRALGNIALALEDYKILYQKYNAVTRDSLTALMIWVEGDQTQKIMADLDKKAKKFNTNIAGKKQLSLSGITLNGDTIMLSKFSGKLVVINVWGISCAPCIKEMPALNKIVARYKANPNIVFLGVCTDSKERLLSFFKTHIFNYEIISQAKIPVEYAASLPTHIILNREGEIISSFIGASNQTADQIIKVIERLEGNSN